MRALALALALSGCAARPSPSTPNDSFACESPWRPWRRAPDGHVYYAKPPPEPRTFRRFDADGRHEDVWTECDWAGGWIQRSHGWSK